MCGESTAKKTQIGRKEQDEFAINSYKKSAEAWYILNKFYLRIYKILIRALKDSINL